MEAVHLLINKEDITEHLMDVGNIDDKKLNREIFDVQEFSFRKQIPSELYDLFISVKSANYRSWSRSRSYAINDRVIHDGKLWVAKAVNTGSLPAADNANWEEKSVWYLFKKFIVPYLVFVAFSKYSVDHGLNASPHGFKKVSEDNVESITSSERAGIVNKYQNRGDKYLMGFMEYLSSNNYTIDGVKYTFTSDNSRKSVPKIKFKGV